MYGIVLIAVLAVTGGAIAYIGDRLGTKVGKRKLTIFGLRPKHTSILVTIITGILIVSSTLGVLSLVSRDVRTALFGMDELRARLSSLSADVTTKNQELEASRAELEAKTKEYSGLTAKIKETAAQLAAITDELSKVAAERDRTAASLKQMQADYAQAKGDLTKAATEIQALEATKKELDTRVTSLNQAKTNLQSDVDRLNELTVNLKEGLQVVREGSILYQAGEVLSTSVVSGASSREDIENHLRGIVYSTNQMLINKLGLTGKEINVLWISKSDFDQAVEAIAAEPETAVVRIAASGNTVYGEPVIGSISVFPNRHLYSDGTVVYSQVFDIPDSSKATEELVLRFLQQVNAAAIKQGILADPLQGTVGSISGAQFYDTVNKVKRYNSGKIEMTAVANGNVTSIGPLTIDIRVRNIN